MRLGRPCEAPVQPHLHVPDVPSSRVPFCADGSGADNFYDAGSCIDGRLTSAWNWCSKLAKKPYAAARHATSVFSRLSPRAHRLASHLLLCHMWQVLPTLQDVRVCGLRWRLQQVTAESRPLLCVVFTPRASGAPPATDFVRSARGRTATGHRAAHHAPTCNQPPGSSDQAVLRSTAFKEPRSFSPYYRTRLYVYVRVVCLCVCRGDDSGLSVSWASPQSSHTHTRTRARAARGFACLTARGRRNPPHPP